MFDDWVIDATLWRDGLDMPTFVPVEGGHENPTFVTGMNYIADKCPGNLLGVVHMDGEEAAKKWAESHPDWRERWSK